MRPIHWVAILSTFSLPALGEELPCSGASSGIGCFDAAPFQGPAEPSPFRWFGRGRVLLPSQVAGTIAVRHATRPAELVAPGSDPNGRLVPVVKQTTRLDLRIAVGLGRGLDLTLLQPFGLFQQGSGPDAITTQAPTRLLAAGIGDSMVSFRTRLPRLLQTFDWALRMELTLPIGSERAYLGNRDMAEAVAVNAHWSAGGLSIVSDAGIRVSRTTRFGDTNLGTHAFWGLGVDYAPLTDDLLHFSLEALLRPMLVASPNLADTKVHAEQIIPADWLGSVTSRPFSTDLWFSVGAGTALPRSRRSGGDARVDGHFIAPTSPRLQLIASLSLRH